MSGPTGNNSSAGFTSHLLKTTDAVLEMQELLQNSVELQGGVTAKAKVAGYLDSTKKALGRTTVIFSVYGLYKDLEKTMQAGRSGDSVEHSLRWIQIGIRATSIAAGFVPGGVLVSLALESGNLAITGYITLRESLKLGVEAVIGQINNQLANGELFRKNHRELVTNRKYYLSSDSLYVSHRLGEQQYRIGSTLHATLKEVQDRLKAVRFVNVDPVSGGAVLYNRGYSISDIAFITAKQQRLRPVEVNFIEGFGQAGVFDLRDWAARMPTTQYRFPNEDYYSNRDIKGMWGSSTEHWLYYAPVSYFKEHYPATEVAFTQY